MTPNNSISVDLDSLDYYEDEGLIWGLFRKYYAKSLTQTHRDSLSAGGQSHGAQTGRYLKWMKAHPLEGVGAFEET